MNDQNLNGLVLTIFSGLFIVSVVLGSVVLRAAVVLYNKFNEDSYEPSPVPEPSLGDAFRAALIASIVNGLALLFVSFVTYGAMTKYGFSKEVTLISVRVACIPVFLVLMSLVFGQVLSIKIKQSSWISVYFLLITGSLAGIAAAVFYFVLK